MVVQPGNAIPGLTNIQLNYFISIIFVNQVIYPRAVDTRNISCF